MGNDSVRAAFESAVSEFDAAAVFARGKLPGAPKESCAVLGTPPIALTCDGGLLWELRVCDEEVVFGGDAADVETIRRVMALGGLWSGRSGGTA